MYESGPQLSDSVRRAQLLRVVARWLSEARCSRAALILARSVGVIGHTHAIKTSSVGDSSRRQVLCVNVETMSGVKLGTFKGLSASTSTIGDLKQKLADRLGDAFPPELQRLFAVGSSVHFWDASATFRKCGVEDGATLVLVLQANFEWDVKASNKHLKYSENLRQVTRPGKVSSYPCARTKFKLEHEGDSFCVRLKALPAKPNGLTVGVLNDIGHFRNEESNGVGGCQDTMGVCIANVLIRLFQPKQKKQCIRCCAEYKGPELKMFKKGDTLRFQLGRFPNSTIYFLDFIFNGKHEHREPLPKYFELPLQPLCTLPDDCILELIA